MNTVKFAALANFDYFTFGGVTMFRKLGAHRAANVLTGEVVEFGLNIAVIRR